MRGAHIRLASEHDLDELVALEEAAFASDRFSETQLDYLLTRSRATVLVMESDRTMAGAAYMLWRKAHRAGRLYNIAVNPAFQGRGYGARLLDECEREAAIRGCERVTLEVRRDNETAIRLYESHGYTIVRTLNDYYEDGSAGYKMAKILPLGRRRHVRLRVPYWAQSLDFTCGPASVMMALKYHLPEWELSRSLEMKLWKEATLIFTTSGFGGTSPYGLALAAAHRGLDCWLVTSKEDPPFLRSVRSDEKRDVITLVHDDMKQEAYERSVSSASYEYGFEDIVSALHRNMIPVVLISTHRLTGDRAPHWVVVTGFDGRGVFIHDPDAKSYRRGVADSRHLRLDRDEFIRMSRYGKEVYRCLVMIGGPRGGRRPGRDLKRRRSS